MPQHLSDLRTLGAPDHLHAARAVAAALRVLRGPAAAEDALQDALVRLG